MIAVNRETREKTEGMAAINKHMKHKFGFYNPPRNPKMNLFRKWIRKTVRILCLIFLLTIFYIQKNSSKIAEGKNKLQIFVYNLPELSSLQDTLTSSQFATENIVHEQIIGSQNVTTSPLVADYFFVPLYPMGVVYKYKKSDDLQKDKLYRTVTRFVDTNLNISACSVEMRNKKWCKRLRYQAAVLEYTISLLQYWDSLDKKGSRHIFVFPGGNRQSMFPNWKHEIQFSIHLLVEGYEDKKAVSVQSSSVSRLRKDRDIIIPGGGDLIANSFIDEKHTVRDVFLYYCGDSSSNEERRSVKDLFTGVEKDGKPTILYENCSKTDFEQIMKRSKYCLAPAGKTPWTSRLYLAISL